MSQQAAAARLSRPINVRLMQTKMMLRSLVRPVSDKTVKEHCAMMELVHKPDLQTQFTNPVQWFS